MAIKGLGQDATVHQDLPEFKIQNKKVEIESQKSQLLIENKTRINENAIGSSIMKEALNRLFDKNGVLKTADPVPPKPPIDYFAVDKQADELIKKHTEDHWYGSELKANELGKELADIAKTKPELAAALADNILDKIAGSDKDEVSQSFVETLSPTELRDFAKTDEGKKALEQMKDHLLSGSVHGDERDTAHKIDTAIKAAELEKNPSFQKLDKDVQQEILSRLEKNSTDENAVDNLINLVVTKPSDPLLGGAQVDPNFAKLPVDSQKALLQAYDNHSGDKIFVDSLKLLTGKSGFSALNPTDQSQVINDLDRFANTESYKGKEGGLFGIGSHHVSDDDKKWLLDNVGNISIYSAENPAITSVRNTLDKAVSGDIKVGTYSEAKSADGGIGYGYADGNTIHLNKHPDASGDLNELVDTFVHEINHIINADTKAGTPERFLDEYRAWITGNEAGGKTVDAETLKEILDNLGHSPNNSYGHLRDLYTSNDKFRKVIDEVYDGLNETPPKIVKSEELRQKLLDAGFDSDYLKKAGNLDNH